MSGSTQAVQYTKNPWSVWLRLVPVTTPSLVINIAGLLTSNPRLQGVLAVLSLLMNIAVLFLLPTNR